MGRIVLGGAVDLHCHYGPESVIGVPHKADYPDFDQSEWGLMPVELEEWRGFLFVRLEGGGPGVAVMPDALFILPFLDIGVRGRGRQRRTRYDHRR